MTRRRWIADEHSEGRAALTGPNAAHLARVLRAEVGQEFDIAVEGSVRRGRIRSVGDDRVEFELGEEVPVGFLPDLTLLLAIFKFDRMEWAIEKVTELGVGRIVPVIARRTDAHLVAASAKRLDRWHRLARQAAQQSRRVTAPEIVPPTMVSEAVEISAQARILLAESEKQQTLREVLEQDGVSNSFALAVGPEGGWTSEELKTFAAAGFIAAALGPTILRAETAAIAAVAITLAQLS